MVCAVKGRDYIAKSQVNFVPKSSVEARSDTKFWEVFLGSNRSRRHPTQIKIVLGG